MSRNKVARLNELLLKVLYHNICVTVMAMYRMRLDLEKFYEVY